MRTGSIRLFKILGITVYLHISWFLILLFEMSTAGHYYSSPVWQFLEIVALFGIVLIHEFGHALACRSVGGQADTIILWPFGGFAYVSPPWRPGAMLWSIVAGPLVNVILIPITIGIFWLAVAPHVPLTAGNFAHLLLYTPASVGNMGRFLSRVVLINIILLIFNMLPVYPLDGGKILWSLLWFVTGEGLALRIASVVGLVGSGLLALLAFNSGQIYMMLLSAFLIYEAVSAYRQSSRIIARNKLPRHTLAHCPNCDESPPVGTFWTCGHCGTHFDMFASPRAQCPQCGASYINTEIQCPECRSVSPVSAWFAAATVDPIEPHHQ
ncbi:MAG: site-2 protease family protein [Phycisphaerae bacterium]